MNLSVAQLAAAVVAGLVLLAIAIAPAETLEALVMASGLPAVLPAAAAPLGLTARAALLFVAACGFGALGWALVQLGFGVRRTPDLDTDDVAELPSIRRADAHPDAPARAPVRAARDLGDPFAADLAAFAAEPGDDEIALPADLDTPLAAFDPGAVRPIPLTADRPARLDAGERIETFELTPARRPAPVLAAPPVDIEPAAEAPIAGPETEATIHALLARLERGVERRRRSPAPPQIHAALDSLRHAVGA
ncbi:hypothetical protein [Sphingomonas japonica]|nr:hypothetical protein [Sphingomonas japonica]